MTDDITLTLNNPLTDEQWDAISDVDFDRTDHIRFHTKHGKEVEFAKVIRCKDCKYSRHSTRDDGHETWLCWQHSFVCESQDFCSWAERKEE